MRTSPAVAKTRTFFNVCPGLFCLLLSTTLSHKPLPVCAIKLTITSPVKSTLLVFALISSVVSKWKEDLPFSSIPEFQARF